MNKSIIRASLIFTCSLFLLYCAEPISDDMLCMSDYIEVDKLIEVNDKFDQEYSVCLSDGVVKNGIFDTSKVVVLNDLIYVLSLRRDKLFVFNSEGLALSAVGNRGRGRGEYYIISDFDVDLETGYVYIIDGQSNKLIKYDETFKHISSADLHFQADNIKCLDSGNLLFKLSSWNQEKHSDKAFVVTTKLLKTIKTMGKHPRIKDDNFIVSDSFFTQFRNSIYFHKSISDEVLVIDCNGNITKKILFDFGKYTFPERCKNDFESAINDGTINNTQFLMSYPTKIDNGFCGTLFDKGTIYSFVINEIDHTIYKEPIDVENPSLGSIVGISDNKIITSESCLFNANEESSYLKLHMYNL